ncbi:MULTISPECIES: HAD-IA family hydrolase [Rhizobium/Agrobacterium group]|uniref:HAD-IA family hydrolase n=1 Tax=Rhizobium/Agrobacterium group TaxID=227290 RepID=UPI0009B9A72E|nr:MULTISPECIES: HAD-IA family hydrolase [Rhizobium/Agrobacterium group]MBB4402792.1 sugar-phosphatase [Agrobacterium radiobacter]MBB5589297.1 sugar-phosphatase [Agrobacterium radiobacter]TGE85874.1 glycerol-3-phosphatase [Rhizobium sp. SEMIA 4032]CUX56217.1 Sugar phosphatase YfbT [Agrobacterium deltaense RV3]
MKKLKAFALEAMLFDAFLFDMDGTILDSRAASDRVWGGWARDNGIPTPPYHGRRVQDTMADLRHTGIDPLRAAAEIEARELEDLDGVTAIPGAADFLSLLPPERWAVVTSAPRALALRRIGAAGLRMPRNLIAAEDVKRGKPSPDPFLAGAQLLSFAPSRCLVFEDADAGIRSGEAAGCSVLVIMETETATLVDRPSITNYRSIRAVSVADGLSVRFSG